MPFKSITLFSSKVSCHHVRPPTNAVSICCGKENIIFSIRLQKMLTGKVNALDKKFLSQSLEIRK